MQFLILEESTLLLFCQLTTSLQLIYHTPAQTPLIALCCPSALLYWRVLECPVSIRGKAKKFHNLLGLCLLPHFPCSKVQSSPQVTSCDPVIIRKINVLERQYRSGTAKGLAQMEQCYKGKGKVLTCLWRSRLTGKTPQGRNLQLEILPSSSQPWNEV